MTAGGLALRDQTVSDAVSDDDAIEVREPGTPIAPEHPATVKVPEDKYAARDHVYDAAMAAGIE